MTRQTGRSLRAFGVSSIVALSMVTGAFPRSVRAESCFAEPARGRERVWSIALIGSPAVLTSAVNGYHVSQRRRAPWGWTLAGGAAALWSVLGGAATAASGACNDRRSDVYLGAALVAAGGLSALTALWARRQPPVEAPPALGWPGDHGLRPIGAVDRRPWPTHFMAAW